MACVQAEEKRRINQFVFAEDASLSLVSSNIQNIITLYQIGRLLLRAAAVRMAGLANDVIVFSRTEKWKPFLVGNIIIFV